MAALSLALLGLAVSLFQAKRYAASAVAILDIRSPDLVSGNVLNALLASTYLSTQVDILRSERVSRKVVGMLEAGERAQLREAWESATDGRGDFESWAARRVGKELKVTPSPDSSLVEIRYVAGSAEDAARMANAFLDAYTTTSLELRQEPAREFGVQFAGRLEQLRREVDAARERLSAFRGEHGLTTSDERLDVESTRLSELASRLVEAQAAAQSAGTRGTLAGARDGQLSESLKDPLVATLSAQLAERQAAAREIAQRLGARHPQLVEARSRIAEIQRRLDAARANVAGAVRFDAEVYDRRMAEARAALEAQRERVVSLKAVRDQAGLLERDLDNAQRAYTSVYDRSNQIRLEGDAIRTSVSSLQRASVPAAAFSPRPLVNLLVGAVMGVLLALGYILAAEAADRRVRLDEDILDLDSHVLVSLPVRGQEILSRPPTRVAARAPLRLPAWARRSLG